MWRLWSSVRSWNRKGVGVISQLTEICRWLSEVSLSMPICSRQTAASLVKATKLFAGPGNGSIKIDPFAQDLPIR